VTSPTTSTDLSRLRDDDDGAGLAAVRAARALCTWPNRKRLGVASIFRDKSR
jgi:hypothetical protein